MRVARNRPVIEHFPLLPARGGESGFRDRESARRASCGRAILASRAKMIGGGQAKACGVGGWDRGSRGLFGASSCLVGGGTASGGGGWAGLGSREDRARQQRQRNWAGIGALAKAGIDPYRCGGDSQGLDLWAAVTGGLVWASRAARQGLAGTGISLSGLGWADGPQGSVRPIARPLAGTSCLSSGGTAMRAGG